ncbi:MAG TPA: helix-turn-helix domain-containing protein [Acidimicrobiales bacterium]|nr:helix-turn-helix domain-containing protein [Acidimicrobiales bacterium]
MVTRDQVPEERAADRLNLKQVARALGVHYMTAYRYVRQGRLPAVREGNVWMVDPADVESLASQVERRAPDCGVTDDCDPGAGARGPVDWLGRFRDRLLAGDEVGGWTVVSQALASGYSPQWCYLELISAAMAGIGEGIASGRLAVADQYVATATAQRVGARLGARFRRRGRSRGTVVLGAPTGERHALPIAVVSDLVRLAGFTVVELGADVPPEAFGLAARRAERPIAVGIGVTTVAHLDAARAAVARVRADAPGVPVLIGGQAVRSPEVAGLLGVTVWAADGDEVVAAIERLAADRQRAARRKPSAMAVTTSPLRMPGTTSVSSTTT